MTNSKLFTLGLATLLPITGAFSTFETSCTTPDTTTNFVSVPNTRGTLDILWGCLFTIIACTWSIQHLNIPEQRGGRDPGWRGWIKWKLKTQWMSMKWMIYTAIAPELILGKSCFHLLVARQTLPEIQELASQDAVPWSLTHSLFANMGGFVLKSSTPSQRPYIPETPSYGKVTIGTDSTSADSVTTSQYTPIVQDDVPPLLITPQTSEAKIDDHLDNTTIVAAASGRTFTPGPGFFPEVETQTGHIDTPRQRSGSQQTAEGPPTIHLLLKDLVALRRAGILGKLPNLTEEDINDKSKGDDLAQGIAIAQIAWTLVQVAVRGARGLSIAQLEISVLAFSLCAIITYAFNWKKPKSVQVPYTIWQPSLLEAMPFIDTSNLSYMSFGSGSRVNLHAYRSMDKPIPNNLFEEADGVFFVALGSIVLGAVRLAAWNFAFPTRMEKLLWRGTNLFIIGYIFVTMVLGIIPACIQNCIPRFRYGLEHRRTLNSYIQGRSMDTILSEYPIPDRLAYYLEKTSGWVEWLMMKVYTLCRIFVVVEMFRCLFFLPPAAFVSSWAANIPHVT